MRSVQIICTAGNGPYYYYEGSTTLVNDAEAREYLAGYRLHLWSARFGNLQKMPTFVLQSDDGTPVMKNTIVDAYLGEFANAEAWDLLATHIDMVSACSGG